MSDTTRHAKRNTLLVASLEEKSKPAHRSKTIIGGIACLAVFISQLAGIEITDAESQRIGEAVAGLIGVALVIYGRWKADSRVHVLTPPPEIPVIRDDGDGIPPKAHSNSQPSTNNYQLALVLFVAFVVSSCSFEGVSVQPQVCYTHGNATVCTDLKTVRGTYRDGKQSVDLTLPLPTRNGLAK